MKILTIMPEGRETVSLLELNEMVRFAVRRQLPDSYWVTAEINEARIGGGGHCYLEFVEKNSNGNVPVAKARGVIWAGNYRNLSRKFEEQTGGMAISAGLKVMVNVTVDFHELYGYTLTVVDIDPSYTLGDLYMRRQEIIRRLEDEGVINMNRELEFPLVPQRVAVISSPTAAGYGDFVSQLENNPYNIRFDITLFPAVMQGEQVENSIISALDSIYANADDFDVVVIIRGGGASSDLSGFDSYNLAYHCTQFPLPVLAGIGHERDRTVVDYVANVSVKTPTAAAQYLITSVHDFAVMIEGFASGIRSSVTRHVSDEKLWQVGLLSTVNTVAARYLHSQKIMMADFSVRINSMVRSRIGNEHNRLSVIGSNIPLICRNIIGIRRKVIETDRNNIRLLLKSILGEERHSLELCRQTVYNIDPKRIMERGFVVMRHEGKAVRKIEEVSFGKKYNIETADGNIDVIINKENQVWQQKK